MEDCGIIGIPSEELSKDLEKLSTPKFKISHGNITNNKLQISNIVEALEIKLIEINLK